MSNNDPTLNSDVACIGGIEDIGNWIVEGPHPKNARYVVMLINKPNPDEQVTREESRCLNDALKPDNSDD